MIHQSKVNHTILHLEDRISSLRFMLMMPLAQPFGISALPECVFTYIYEVGAMEDLPWIKWVDDDTGNRIYRWRRTEDPEVVYDISKNSPLFRSLSIDHIMRNIRYSMIGVDKFELMLLNYARSWPK